MTVDEVRSKIENTIDAILKDTQHYSFTRVILKHPLYQELVNYGQNAIGILLNRLEKSEGDPMLMRMLHEVAKGGPEIPVADRGRIKKMREHWLAWGAKWKESHAEKQTGSC